MADDAGALLVRNGLIAEEQLLRARQRQTAAGGTLGEHLVLAGVVDDNELTRFYRSRLMVPQVAPNDLARIAARVIAKIPSDMAVEFRVVPVALDADGSLTIAMSDPSSTHAVDEIGFFTGHYVVRAVATQLQIAWCLAHYYGCVTPLGETLLRSADSPADGVPRAVQDAVVEPVAESITDRVEAARHRVRPPVTTPSLGVGGGAAGGGRSGGEARRGAAAPSRARAEETGPTGPTRASSPRPAQEAPELPARAGEVRVRSEIEAVPESSRSDLPAVVLDEQKGTETSPVLLERPRRPSEEAAGGAAAGGGAVEEDVLVAENEPEPDSSVVLLEHPKQDGRRRARQTMLGLGIGAQDDAGGAAADGVSGEPTGEVTSEVARPSAVTDEPTGETTEEMVAPPFAQDEGAADGDAAADDAAADDDTAEDDAAPVKQVEEHTGRFARIEAGYLDEIDDGWGPPGTTIPPPYLGAVHDAEAEDHSSIPIVTDGPDGETGRVKIPVPSAPPTRALSVQDSAAIRVALEDSSLRLVEAVRKLDAAGSRDEVIEQMIAHLAGSYERVAFFAMKAGSLSTWRQRGPGAAAARSPSSAQPRLSLDAATNLQDVVRTRLPYRGPLDATSRQFVIAAMGSAADEILAVPVAVRDRVVGVLYGDGERKRVFEEHLSVVTRAAGMALERILMAAKQG